MFNASRNRSLNFAAVGIRGVHSLSSSLPGCLPAIFRHSRFRNGNAEDGWSARVPPALSRVAGAGFTLIEVMIVVAIISILAAIALPSYNDYIRRSQLQDAFHVLSDDRAKMEQYYQDSRNYGSGTCANAIATPTNWASFPDSQYFTYTCALTGSGPTQTYLITATGNKGRAIGHVFTIDQNGNRKTSEFKGNAVAPAADCWLTRSPAC